MNSTASLAPSLPARSRFRPMFIGQSGLRSGWRLLLFVVILLIAEAFPARVLRHFVPQVHDWVKSQPAETINPGFSVFLLSWETSFLFVAVWLMSKIEKRSFFSYGLPRQGAFGRKFGLGLLVGLGAVSCLLALIGSFGGYSAGSLALGVGNAVKYALLWAIVFLLVAVYEESLFRGYAQVALTAGVGFWPAAIILSAVFAAWHLSSPGEQWPGLLMVFCYGIVAALTLRRTGDLWFIVGLHAAWDWAHVFLFSVPIAGMKGSVQLLHSTLLGPRWLTGERVGPDGSVFAFVLLAVIAVLVDRVSRARAQSAGNSSMETSRAR